MTHRTLLVLLVVLWLPLACGLPKERTEGGPTSKPAAAPGVVPAAASPSADVPRSNVYGVYTFSTSDAEIATTACLSVEEIAPQGGYAGAAPMLEALLKACTAKDQKAYEAIAVADQLQKLTNCGLTMDALFSQCGQVAFQRIDHVYAFDAVVLVDARLRMGERDISYAFELARGSDGKLRYAPCPEQTPFHTAVRSWLSDPKAGDEWSPRCPAEVVARATHRVPLGPDPARAGALLLRGAPFAAPGDLGAIAGAVTTALGDIDRALSGGDLRDLEKRMGEEGAATAKWWPTASEQERALYRRDVTGYEPLFVVDAAPLVVVYARRRSKIRPMYFLPGKGGVLVWTNRYFYDKSNALFGDQRMLDAAALAEPFSAYRIK